MDSWSQWQSFAWGLFGQRTMAGWPWMGASEAPKDAAAKYRGLALDCLNLAEAAHDRATQDQVLRLAKRWAKLADRAASGANPRWAGELRAGRAVFCPETGKFNS
jgi:hypothetical protein